MKPSSKILVIIVTWNKKEYVVNLLKSLSDIDFPKDRLDLLVVDNASNDGTVEAINEQFPEVHLICNKENLGGTGGFNTGLSWAFEQPESHYDYLWLLDNDVVVHNRALSELILILEQNPDIAIAGSTMMQLDYPWRVNEMGAFVDRGRGTLIFNRHLKKVPGWREKPLQDLLKNNADLSSKLSHCQPMMDVDYVAAASLLIRAPVARKAGLWMDFFIHYDDVEWCLRIEDMGHRIAVSARSLIWHLSAVAKVPSWILYYDNRNVLYLLEKHSGKEAVTGTIRWILKKALYYCLLGKKDLADLHLQAIADFKHKITGKKEIRLSTGFHPTSEILSVFSDPAIKRIIIPWTVDLQAANIQTTLVKAMRQRTDLSVFYIVPPQNGGKVEYPLCQLPGSIPLHMPRLKLLRYLRYFRIRGDFDLALQSDYQPILPLSWVARENLFVNYESYCRRPRPAVKDISAMLPTLLAHWKQN